MINCDFKVFHPLGGASYVFERNFIKFISSNIKKKNVVISVGAQPNSSPHFGTLCVFSLAFSLARKLMDYNQDLKISVLFEVVDTAPNETVNINGINYQYNLKNSEKMDMAMKDFISVLDYFSKKDRIPYKVRNQNDFNSQPEIKKIISKIIKSRKKIEKLLDPKKEKLRIRVACPKCGLVDKEGNTTTISKKEIISTCPKHGKHKAIYKNELPFLTTIKDIIRYKFGKFSFIPLTAYKIHNILTRPNRLQTLKNLFVKIKKHSKNTKVIYTCISGEYDFMPIIQTYYAKDWRYVCFTNNKKLLRFKHLGMWEIRKMQFAEVDNTRNARWHKLHPHILFPDCNESLWIDANLDILTDKLFAIINIRNADILIPEHNLRDCIFEELEAVKKVKLDDEERLQKVENYLLANNMPKSYGLNETNIMYRKHNVTFIKKIMNEWWNMIENYSKRDQLSLSYVLWKNKIAVKDLSIDNARTDIENFNIYTHNLPNSFGGRILKFIFY